jgi:hypothetical protein
MIKERLDPSEKDMITITNNYLHVYIYIYIIIFYINSII